MEIAGQTGGESDIKVEGVEGVEGVEEVEEVEENNTSTA
jgi:hypothetical protein